jgi:hypothetical protein
MKKNWYESAERSFSEGLLLEPGNVPLRLNRSLLHLKTGRFRAGLVDAVHVLSLDRKNLSSDHLQGPLQICHVPVPALALGACARDV